MLAGSPADCISRPQLGEGRPRSLLRLIFESICKRERRSSFKERTDGILEEETSQIFDHDPMIVGIEITSGLVGLFGPGDIDASDELSVFENVFRTEFSNVGMAAKVGHSPTSERLRRVVIRHPSES